jgi:hypothetical protein
MVSLGLSLYAALHAADAGRVHESGTGAMWIAPELVAGSLPVQHCGQKTALQSRELTFETLDPRDIDTELPRLLASATREVVTFEWNAATGELAFSTNAASSVFSDLAASSRISPSARNCGSR